MKLTGSQYCVIVLKVSYCTLDKIFHHKYFDEKILAYTWTGKDERIYVY